MIFRRIAILLLGILPLAAVAQISPGRLARAHRDLEGIDKCVSCHPYGKALSNDTCLACHKEIRAVLDSTYGVHAHIVAEKKLCAGCHSDHNGEDFRIVKFDTTGFRHYEITGFVLDGKHASVPCDSCHTFRSVTVPGVKALQGKRSHTYLGLSSICASCHQDIHRGQFVQPCSSCHDTKSWKPATLFTHDKSRYPLTGKHEKVECRQCHTGTMEGTKTVVYRDMRFATCDACHSDPHEKKFTRRCDECHTTSAWTQKKDAPFDHQRTEFPLKGKHAVVRCLACHAATVHAVNASGEKGFHISRFHECADCHTDAHAGQFSARADKGRCESCHTEKDWKVVTYGGEDHARSRYPLTGAHVATACASCHKPNLVRAASSVQLRWATLPTCVGCHTDPHKGQFVREKKDCESCHTTSAWNALTFDHARTKFPLDGKHALVQCAKCHEKKDPVPYADVPTVCAPCHKDPHGGQLAKGGSTRCEPCHTAISWNKTTFDHTRDSRYALVGAHVNVACMKCHPSMTRDGATFVRYKPLGMDCQDCHKTTTHELTHE